MDRYVEGYLVSRIFEFQTLQIDARRIREYVSCNLRGCRTRDSRLARENKS